MQFQSPEASAVVEGMASPIRRTTHPEKVLVVEDNLDAVHALAMLVRDMGHHVQFAINGYAALEIARHFRPRIVLLDLGLPGMDGFDLCRRLKRDPATADARVVVITAYRFEEHRARSLAVGAELFLVKPVSPATLFEVLESSAPG